MQPRTPTADMKRTEAIAVFGRVPAIWDLISIERANRPAKTPQQRERLVAAQVLLRDIVAEIESPHARTDPPVPT